MKKALLLLASISLVLLTGCQEKGPVESPSFASFGKETTFAAFDVRRNSLPSVNPIVNGYVTPGVEVPSFSYSSQSKYEITTLRRRSGDGGALTLSEITTDVNRDNAGSYDSTNEVFAFVEKNKYVSNEKYTGAQNSAEDAYTEHLNRQYQKGTIEEEDKIFIFNIYLKTYTPTDYNSELIPQVSATHACERALSPLAEIPDVATWGKFSDNKKKEYKFYADGKTVTMTVESVVETEQKDTIDGEEKVTLKSKTETKRTCQFIIDEKEMKCRFYEEAASSVERIDYFVNRIVSETITTKSVSAFEGNLKIDNKISLKQEDQNAYRPGDDRVDIAVK